MGNALDAGKTMLAGILAKLPETARAAVQQAFEAPEATDAVTELGARTLAQSEFSRQMDALREQETQLQTDYQNLNAWYETQKTKLSEHDTLAAEVARLKGGSPVPKPETPPTPGSTPPAGLTVDQFRKELAATERGAALYLNAVSRLGIEHFQKFGEVLDPDQLMALAEQKRVSILDAYKLQYGEKLAAKAAEEEKARIDKLVEDRLIEERKRMADQPFPLRNQAPSALDVLQTKDGPAAHTVDTAVAEYERLQAARG